MGFQAFNCLKYFLLLICMNSIVRISSADIFILPRDDDLQYTEAPFDQETTLAPINYNITLDTTDDTVNRTDWRISRPVNHWFEYYNNTSDLRKDMGDEKKCPNVISDLLGDLDEVEGIWVACQDPTLLECPIGPSAPCHPIFTYSVRGSRIKTVKIKLFLSGLAVVRLTMGSNSVCYDYSIREDPFSSCEFVGTQNASKTEWSYVKSMMTGYDDQLFAEFSIQVITRFKGDVALIDKTETTDFLLCGDDDQVCSTTSAGPTNTNSPPATSESTTEALETTTEEQETTTEPSKDGTTTKRPTPNAACHLYTCSFSVLALTFFSIVSSFLSI